MKKIFLFLLLLISFKGFCQRQPQSFGSPNTDVYSKGTIGSDSGHVFRVCRTDTTAWNLGLIKNIPHIVVVTCDDKLWIRDNTAVKWVLIGTGAGSTDTSNIIIDSTYDDLAYSPTQDSLWIKSQQINWNGVPVIPTSDNYKLSYNIIGGAGSVTDANNGLVDSLGRILLGQNPLYKNTTIGTSASTLTVSTSVGGVNPLFVDATTGVGVLSNVTNGTAFSGIATTGIGGLFTSGNLPLWVVNASASAANIGEGISINRTGAGVVGMGTRILTNLPNTSSSIINASSMITGWTNATPGAETSYFELDLNNAGSGNTPKVIVFGDGKLLLTGYGAGTLTTDGSGNVTATSDVRLKNVKGKFRSGLNAVMNINPIVYKWNEKSGFDTKNNYIGFSAQNIQSVLGPDAVGQDKEGYLSIQDRAIMAALVNAIKEQQKEIESLQKQILKR